MLSKTEASRLKKGIKLAYGHGVTRISKEGHDLLGVIDRETVPDDMEAGVLPCSNLTSFADGELGPDEADTFRNHLPTCEACLIGLAEALSTNARLSHMTKRE